MISQKFLKTRSKNLGTSQVFLSLFLLLLAFFVFLNSISSYEEMKSYRVAKSVRANFPSLIRQGDSAEALGQSENNELSPNIVKRIETVFRFALPNIELNRVSDTKNIQINIPLITLFDKESGLPRKNTQVLLRNISKILKDSEKTNPLKTEIFFGYQPSSNGIELDGPLKSKISFIIETMLKSGAPQGFVAIGLEPSDPNQLSFKITKKSNYSDPYHRGRSW
jgi:hypothetical protein